MDCFGEGKNSNGLSTHTIIYAVISIGWHKYLSLFFFQFQYLLRKKPGLCTVRDVALSGVRYTRCKNFHKFTLILL